MQGLDYFGARYFSSAQGRFVSPDPTVSSAHPENPQSWNRYSYVYNNPLGLIDPDGRQALDPNVQRMLALLRAPMSKSGVPKGGLIQYALQHGVNFVLGEIFGYTPRAMKGALSMDEYRQLKRVSSYEKGALMLGVGTKNAPGIDALDLDNAKGISLKTAANVARVEANAELALEQVTKAGFQDVQVYIFASNVSKSDVSGIADIQKTLGTGAVTKVVIFTKDGPVVYQPTEAQQKARACVAGPRENSGASNTGTNQSGTVCSQ